MSIGNNKQNKILILIQYIMKKIHIIHNGVSNNCLKKYLLIRQNQIKQESQLQKMIN